MSERVSDDALFIRWKRRFSILAGVSSVLVLGLSGALLYTLIDAGVSKTYLGEGYADCEAHRDFLSALLEGLGAKAAILGSGIQVKRTVEGFEHMVAVPDFRFSFDERGFYRGSELGASRTPGFRD